MSRATPRQAAFALAVLTAMNLLNYVDRYLVTALLPHISRELQLSDGEGGLLGTAFILVYALTSPLFGRLGDRSRRPRWLALGVGIWSLATAAAGLARQLPGLFFARAAVGVGEAAYGTIAPALLADTFKPAAHGRVMAIFSVALPVGSALGYLLGGLLGTHVGWRQAFFVVGLPGLGLAALALALYDPPRSAGADTSLANDDAPRQGALAQAGAFYAGLWRNVRYRTTVLGFTAYTFALGGMAFWMPTYLLRTFAAPQEKAMLLFGGVTVATGIVGTLAGGALGDRLARWRADGYAWLNSLSMVAAGIAALAMLQARTLPVFLTLMAVAQLMAFLGVGPVNAILVGSVPAQIRASAMAACILCIHLLGDAISPVIIGGLSDRLGLGGAMALVPAVFFVAAVLWFPRGAGRRA